MVTAEEIKQAVYKGINRFVKPYKEPQQNIQVVFRIMVNKVAYFTCINRDLKNTIELKNLIGPNVYNWLVNDHIKKLLAKLEKENEGPVKLMGCCRENGDVYFMIMRPGWAEWAAISDEKLTQLLKS